MKVMIVGAAGFIGSTTATYLLKHPDFNVVSIDDLSTMPDPYNLEPARRATSRHAFHVADATDARIMGKILQIERPDTILFAVELDDRGMSAIATIQQECLKIGLDVDKIIVVCSHRGQEGDYLGLPALPDFSEMRNCTVVSTCRVFGPRQHSRHLIPRAIYKNLALTNVPVETNKTLAQEWLYIGEFFKALLMILQADHCAGAYCISSGDVATEHEIAEKISEIIKGDPTFESAKGLSEVISNTLDCSEIRNLGWRPTQNLAKALEHTVRWFSDNTWALR